MTLGGGHLQSGITQHVQVADMRPCATSPISNGIDLQFFVSNYSESSHEVRVEHDEQGASGDESRALS